MIFISSCGPIETVIPAESGEQYVELYGENIERDDLCVYRFQLETMDKSKVYSFVRDHVPLFSMDTEYLVNRIGYGSKSFIDIASQRFCGSFREDHVAKSILSNNHKSFTYLGVLEYLDPLVLKDRFGDIDKQGDVNSSMRNGCTVRTVTSRAIYPHEIFELRYRFAIPILINQWTDRESVILFDNDCSNKESYSHDIFRILDIKKIDS